MSDTELRDAYLTVDVELPNGKLISGRPIPFRTGMRLQALLDAFVVAGTQAAFDLLFTGFSEATGITEGLLRERDPNVSVAEILDLIRRFIYLLRPGRTAAQVSAATPAATAAPALAQTSAVPPAPPPAPPSA